MILGWEFDPEARSWRMPDPTWGRLATDSEEKLLDEIVRLQGLAWRVIDAILDIYTVEPNQ